MSTKLSVNLKLPVLPVAAPNSKRGPTIVSDLSIEVRENQDTNTIIYKAVATDPDKKQTISYSIAGTDSALFTINSNTGELRINNSADFEFKPTYQIQITATDSSPRGLSDTKTLDIQILDVNEAPSLQAKQPEPIVVLVDENKSELVTLLASDPDAGDVLAYSLSGNDASLFSVNEQGSLVFNAPADFENPLDSDADNVYEVSVKVSDTGGLSDNQDYVVAVKDVIDANQITKIHDIQGEGEATAMAGQAVTIQGRITAWLPKLRTFYVEEESLDRDNNSFTSEGIAVFYGSGTAPVDTESIGDVVRLKGTVSEFNGATQISNLTLFEVRKEGSLMDLEPATQVTLPIASTETLERFEGMRVEVSAASGKGLHVGDTFTFARFGETTFFADEVPFQFTETNAPDVAGNAAYQDFLARNSIQLDDGNSAQNPTLADLNAGTRILRDNSMDGIENPTALGADSSGAVNFIRVGDTAESITGVLGYSFGSYEIHATESVNLQANPRPTTVSGLGDAEVKVASFNVLNYFTTLGTANFTNPEGVTHSGRGASNPAEFAEQQAKIVDAMIRTGAHAFGLNELQNNGFGPDSAIASLVNALNAAVGSARYAFITTPKSGTDAIMVGMVYDTTVLKPLGAASTPDTLIYTAFASGNRLPLAQTFSYLTDETKQFTLVVNHLKSKGGTGTGSDADLGDGQGQFAATRLEAAKQLDAWLNTNPTGATDGDYVLAGDLNSYSKEQTLTELIARGYTHASKSGDYSYVFDGLRGSLDHILTKGLSTEITGFTHFNISADEQVALDYNDEFTPSDLRALDRADLYRSSDHDPVIIGLKLNSEAGSPTGNGMGSGSGSGQGSGSGTGEGTGAGTGEGTTNPDVVTRYTENFDSLSSTGTTPSSTLPAGWSIAESGTGAAADNLYVVGTGSSNAGNLYSFGSTGSTERALGSVASGSVAPMFGASFINTTGGNVGQIDIQYTGEQWRLGSVTAGRVSDMLNFQYSVDAVSLTTGTWTDVDSLDFRSVVLTGGTVGARDGNSAEFRANVQGSITQLNLAANQTLWVRWVDPDIAGSDDGLAIDDFSLTLVGLG